MERERGRCEKKRGERGEGFIFCTGKDGKVGEAVGGFQKKKEKKKVGASDGGRKRTFLKWSGKK